MLMLHFRLKLFFPAASMAAAESDEITVGARVWAKMPSYPPWPAQIISIDGPTAHVVFFGDNHQRLSFFFSFIACCRLTPGAAEAL